MGLTRRSLFTPFLNTPHKMRCITSDVVDRSGTSPRLCIKQTLKNKKNPANAKENVQQRCTIVRKWSAVFIRRFHPHGFWLQFQRKPSKTKSVARGRQTTTYLALQRRIGWESQNFPIPLSFSTLVWGDPPSNLWISFTGPETKVFQAAEGEDLVILTCTIFDWSTCVTDRQTDRQNCDG